ncbi:MAG: hypothetical protein WBM00_03140 [Solirubrobacterales bacterium]
MESPIRAIVRYSFNAEATATRTAMRVALQRLGFWRIGTASFEIRRTEEKPDVEPRILEALEEIARVVGDENAAQLDHLWIYVDHPENEGGDQP